MFVALPNVRSLWKHIGGGEENYPIQSYREIIRRTPSIEFVKQQQWLERAGEIERGKNKTT